MKTCLLLPALLILVTACNTRDHFTEISAIRTTNIHPVIWNEDTREDVNLADFDGELAQATALLLHKHRITLDQDGHFSVPVDPLVLNYPLCQEEKFLDQNILGHCSGVLVAPRVLLTAGHCIKEQKYCDDIYITFGRNQEKAQTKRFSEKDLYTCKHILKTVSTPSNDYALIELDREVTQAKPVKIGRSNALTVNDSVLSFSYPLGLPLKKDRGEIIRNDPMDHFIRVKVDTFSGSSGSPLFNSQKELVGILSTGSEDFEDDMEELHRNFISGTCVKVERCTGNNCFGERYLKTEAIDF